MYVSIFIYLCVFVSSTYKFISLPHDVCVYMYMCVCVPTHDVKYTFYNNEFFFFQM